MIQIQIKAKHGHVSIDVSGHANAAPKGEDVICAGVSTLLLTLCEALTRANVQDYDYRLGEGDAHIEFQKNKASKPILFTVMCGFKFLADSYPQYVKVSV